jgi:hypothetical protein
VADECCADGEEGFVDVVAAVVAAVEAPVGVQPRDRALHYPAFFAEAGPVAGAAFGDPGCDATLFERLAVLSAVIGTVSEQRLGPELPVAAGRRDAIDKRQQLGDVVAVPSGERHGQGDALAVADYVVLGARPAAVDR